jgi:dinuclear metal center YbgI/SA1388 family protein
MPVGLAQLVSYLDAYLHVADVPDADGALNGLQVEGARDIRHLAAAVDASEASIIAAVDAHADLLLVHHGLFWDGNLPVTGRRYRRLAPVLRAGLAVYSAHIPLDVHDEVGNNVVLAKRLGLDIRGTFGSYRGVDVGIWGILELSRAELEARLRGELGHPPRLIPGGPEQVTRLGVLTGGGGSYIAAAAAGGLDTLVTGEGAHHTYFDAMEWGLNVLYGGHYATETYGVRALAEHLAERFELTWTFLDHPTGL